MKELGTIEAELAACRAAFQGVKLGASVWRFNHNMILGVLRIPWEERVDEIMTHKPVEQRALRLREFRPMLGKLPEVIQQADSAWHQAYSAYRQADSAREQADSAWDQAYSAYRQADREQAYSAYRQADSAWHQAYSAYRQADSAREQAYSAREQAVRDHFPELQAMHKAEYPDSLCDDPSLFPDYR